jgi:hypothetical protein
MLQRRAVFIVGNGAAETGMAFFQNLLGDPVGQTAIVPFAVGFLLALVLRIVGGNRLAALGIGAAFYAT